MHTCIQQGSINKIESDLQNHIKLQLESDAERMEYRAERKVNDEAISDTLHLLSTNMTELLELNKEVQDFKTAWRVTRSLGLGLAVLIGTLGIISGGIFAIKEWVKK